MRVRRIHFLVLWAVALALLFCGCWTVHRKDPLTIQAFESAIHARKADGKIMERLLADVAENPTHSARAVAQVKYLNEAEIRRLDDAVWREKQKTDQ